MEEPVRKMGRFVKERRNELGLSQPKFGALIGKEQKWVSQFENGVYSRMPDVSVLRALADGLECRVEDLLIAAGYLDEPEDWPPEIPLRSFIADLHIDLAAARDTISALIHRIERLEDEERIVIQKGPKRE